MVFSTVYCIQTRSIKKIEKKTRLVDYVPANIEILRASVPADFTPKLRKDYEIGRDGCLPLSRGVSCFFVVVVECL